MTELLLFGSELHYLPGKSQKNKTFRLTEPHLTSIVVLNKRKTLL